MSFFNQPFRLQSSSRQPGVDSPPQPPPNRSPSVNTQAQSVFLYKRLRVGEIRLIEILPGIGNEPILCSLATHVLDSVAGRYEALSYTWGNSLDKESVYM